MTPRQILNLLRLSDVQRIARMKKLPGRSGMNKSQLISALLRRKNPILMVGNPKKKSRKRKNPILMVGNPKRKRKRKRK